MLQQQIHVGNRRLIVEFAVEWLSGLFGPAVKKALGRSQVTQWNKEPWTQGAFASASPGGQFARRVLMEPLRGRVYFAGEAVHETAWGTVGGAWESGMRAADAVGRRITGQPEPKAPVESSRTFSTDVYIVAPEPGRRGRR